MGKIEKSIDFSNVKKRRRIDEIVEQLKNLPKSDSFVILNCHEKRNYGCRNQTE